MNPIVFLDRDGVKKAGVKITDIFFCPHTPADNCSCRKPAPGLILSAQKKYTLNLEQSIIVGESTKDIECGKNAGCGATLLVKTGNGECAQTELNRKNTPSDHVADNLYSAALWIIDNLKK